MSSAADAQRSPRYVGKLADGSRIEGSTLSDWSKPNSFPRLDGQPLLDSSNPLCWLCDRTLRTEKPTGPWIEMFSGDRMPGTVTGYHRDEGTSLERHFGYWAFEPACEFRPPVPVEETSLRIDARFVRRIVWQPVDNVRLPPATVVTRDGRQLPFRALRPADGGLSLLTDEGSRRLELAEVAELRFPEHDFWSTWMDESASLAPDGQTRLIQLETTDGLLATASLARLTAFAGGSERDTGRWVHGIQPAWSLDVLWIPFGNLVAYRSFPPTLCPLSRVPPEDTGRSAGLDSTRPSQRDRSVDGGTLTVGGQRFGWGWGVHAYRRLEFPLPPLPTRLTTGFGLDQSARDGGCVQARIFLGSHSAAPIYTSPLLVGSDLVCTAGPLECAAADDPSQRLVLEVDPAHEQRPVGADPFDIRDAANWLDPALEFDGPWLVERLAAQAAKQVAAWQDWQAEPASDIRWNYHLRRSPPQTDAFVACVSPADSTLKLHRSLSVSPDNRWLAIAVCRDVSSADPPLVRVTMDGQAVLEEAVPYRDKWQTDAPPLLVPLERFAGRTVAATIEVTGGSPSLPIHWQTIALLDDLPMLRMLFEDRGEFVRVQGEGPEAAPRILNEPYSGIGAVWIPADGEFQITLDRPAPVRGRPDWTEFRFIRFAYRKQDVGSVALELNHPQADQRPARYVTGDGEEDETVKRIMPGGPSEDWTVVTRDIYADFGELDLQSITLSVSGGECALLDHIYIARGIDDFRYVPLSRETAPTNGRKALQR